MLSIAQEAKIRLNAIPEKEPKNGIYTTIMDQPKPPCERYYCGFYNLCKRKELACESFIYYVRTGRSENPRMMYATPKNKKGWKIRQPTGEINENMFPARRHFIKSLSA